MYEKHFCLIWKSNGISFNTTIEELKVNFKVVDDVICDKHGKTSIKYEYRPEKVDIQLTNMNYYDIETFNSDRTVPYGIRKNRLS